MKRNGVALLALVLLGGCAPALRVVTDAVANLPVKLRAQTARAPLAASVKAFSHVPLSAEPNPRDVCDENGEPNIQTRLWADVDVLKLLGVKW